MAVAPVPNDSASTLNADDAKESTIAEPPLPESVQNLSDAFVNPPPESNALQKEFVDDDATANAKIDKLVQMMKASKYTVVMSGAGISTNTQRLADFRGDNGLIENRVPLIKMGVAEQRMDSIMPTFTHVCLRVLMEHGLVRKIITSNHDGLHNKSGVDGEQVVDLFGNVYVEKCRKCKTRYVRRSVVSHLNRRCDAAQCNGKLKRTACNMGESVDPKPLKTAQTVSEAATLSLVLGSSMTVHPFCDLPSNAMPIASASAANGDGDKLGYVLVTRQSTGYDADALLCVHLNVDEFMARVMQRLDLLQHCRQFVYSQVFECSVVVGSDNDLVVVELRSKQGNEGLPFIQNACVQIVKNGADANDEKDGDGHVGVIHEYELQKTKDLNWKFETMKNSLLDRAKGNGVRIEIEWESGFNEPKCYQSLDAIEWNKMEQVQVSTVELRKIVHYDY